jgi:hypothetical protein
MKLEIEPSLAQRINTDAEELLDLPQTAPENSSDVSDKFRPNHLQTTASLVDPEIPSGPVQVTIGTNGAEVERFFPNLNPPVGFFGEIHVRFVDLCQRIQQISDLNSYLSLTYVVEVTFEWVRQRHQKATDKLLIDYLLPKCMRDIARREILLPIAGIDIEQEIDMGKVVIKKLLQLTWQQWIAEWSMRSPAGVANLRQFVTDIGADEVVVASQHVIAEPIRAVETALDWTQSALEVLSYFAPSTFHPVLPIMCAVSGSEFVERPRHMIVQESVLISAGATMANLRSRHPWTIKTSSLKNMKDKGFDPLVRLMNEKEESRTEFQNDILRAISIFSRSSLAQNLTDKLLYAVLALESILLKDQSESLQKHIGERMAFLIGQTVEARRDIISSYKVGYGLRSGAVHHGRVVTDEDTLRTFLPNTWFTLNKLITEADKFPTKQDMIAFVDDIKFS